MFVGTEKQTVSNAKEKLENHYKIIQRAQNSKPSSSFSLLLSLFQSYYSELGELK